MTQDHEASSVSAEMSQESFLGSFSRVPSGLDPTQVYSHFLKMSGRIRQLEEQVKQVSAPFLLESALREVAEIRTQSAQAAERTYNEIVRAAQDEAGRIKAEAERQSNQTLQDAQAKLGDVQKQADELVEQARQEASQVRQQAQVWSEQSEQELERLCVDFANFLQRLLDRRNAARSESGGTAVATVAKSATVAAVAESATVARPAEPAAEPAVDGASTQPQTVPSWLADAPQQAETATVEPEEPAQTARVPEWGAQESRPSPTPPWGGAPTRPAAEQSPASPPWRQPVPPTPPAEPAAPTQPVASSPHEPAEPTRERPEAEKSAEQEKGAFRLPSWLDL